MKEILADIDQWLNAGETAIALATVVNTWGSAPRRMGAKMAVTADGKISGSVSGGCVEGSVVEVCRIALESGVPQLLHYGVADETAWEVGLACGGEIEIFVEVLDEKWCQFYQHAIDTDWAGIIVTIIKGPQQVLGDKAAYARNGERVNNLPHTSIIEMQDLLPSIHASQRVSLKDGLELFIEQIDPPPVLVMVGGVHVSIALTKEAKSMGYRTVVIDPRRSFGSDARFPNVDQLLQEWPKQAFQELSPSPNMAVALLTHDPKIDDQALGILLNSNVFYIGALGSRKTHAKRIERLQAMGFSDDKIARIFAPIGLDIGAENPEEIALAIMAEIVGVKRGKIASA